MKLSNNITPSFKGFELNAYVNKGDYKTIEVKPTGEHAKIYKDITANDGLIVVHYNEIFGDQFLEYEHAGVDNDVFMRGKNNKVGTIGKFSTVQSFLYDLKESVNSKLGLTGDLAKQAQSMAKKSEHGMAISLPISEYKVKQNFMIELISKK